MMKNVRLCPISAKKVLFLQGGLIRKTSCYIIILEQ